VSEIQLFLELVCFESAWSGENQIAINHAIYKCGYFNYKRAETNKR